MYKAYDAPNQISEFVCDPKDASAEDFHTARDRSCAGYRDGNIDRGDGGVPGLFRGDDRPTVCFV